MDPSMLLSLAAGGLGKGGGGTKVSQSVSNNANAVISAVIQGSGYSPQTAPISAPQSGNPTSSASGSESTPSYTPYQLGAADVFTTGADSVAPAATGTTESNTKLYLGAGVLLAAFAGYMLFGKGK